MRFDKGGWEPKLLFSKHLVPAHKLNVSTAPSDVDSSCLTRFIGFRLTRAKVQVHKALQALLSARQLSITEFSILMLANSNPGVYQRQLGQALDISPPNLVAVIERLVQRDLLSRLPSTEDRRLQELHLTESGQTLLRQAESEVAAFEQMLEQRLTATERRYVESALRKLAAFEIEE
jgi:DNA-binding MarR family transcriptional regulator